MQSLEYRVKEGKESLNKTIINTKLHPDYNIISQLPIICILHSAFIFFSDTLYLTCNYLLSSVLSFYICCILFSIYLLYLIFYFFIISILSLSLIQFLVLDLFSFLYHYSLSYSQCVLLESSVPSYSLYLFSVFSVSLSINLSSSVL